MPTYEYRCQSCHELVEDVAKFSDPPLTICPLCGGELKRVFSVAGIAFKGQGFYRTDSRSASSDVASTPSESTAANPESKSAPAPTAKTD